MNKDIFGGNWKQFKGEVQKQWGWLTDNQFDQINGNFQKMVGAIQEKTGRARDAAEKEINEWAEKIRKMRDAA